MIACKQIVKTVYSHPVKVILIYRPRFMIYSLKVTMQFSHRPHPAYDEQFYTESCQKCVGIGWATGGLCHSLKFIHCHLFPCDDYFWLRVLLVLSFAHLYRASHHLTGWLIYCFTWGIHFVFTLAQTVWGWQFHTLIDGYSYTRIYYCYKNIYTAEVKFTLGHKNSTV